MSDSIDQLHADYKSNTRRDRDQQLVARLRSTPGLAAELIQRLLLDLPNLPALLPVALFGLPLDEFEPLARVAASTLRQDPCHAAAQDFIAHASLQALPSLRAHLQELFYVQPNWTTEYAMWPWRETGVTEFEFLKRHMGSGTTFWDGGSSRTTQRAALEALFEIRDPEVLQFLEDRLPRQDFDLHAQDIGIEKSAEGYRKLHSEQPFHLAFPSSYIDGSALAASWLPMTGLEYHGPCLPQGHLFGGEGNGECRRCQKRLVNLITLTPVPPGLGVTGLEQLSLQVCFSCLDLGVLFYEHDNHGSTSESTRMVREGAGRADSWGVLRQTPVGLIRTPERWKWQGWALSNSRENLNRLGGHPAWIQNAEYPSCPQCRQTMIHLLQLDSDLPMEDGSEWWWGSGGCGYVSWCDQCKISAVQCQYT